MIKYKEIFKLYRDNNIKLCFSKLASDLGISRQAIQQAYKRFLAEDKTPALVDDNMEYIESFASKKNNLEQWENISQKFLNEISYFFQKYTEYKDLYSNLEQKQDSESFSKFEGKQKKFIYESKLFIEILKMFHLTRRL